MSKSIVLLSDFGSTDPRTAAMTGVVKTVDEKLDFYPSNIWIPRQDLRTASGVLYSSVPFWPAGTVFLTEVHKLALAPERQLLLRMPNGCLVLAPDNGVVTMPIFTLGVDKIWAVDPGLLQGEYPTAALAARLAAGLVKPEEAGQAVELAQVRQFDLTPGKISPGLAEGAVAMVMHNFGNLTCNISIEDFEGTGIRSGDMVRLTITLDGAPLFDREALYHHSFGFAAPGDPIVFNGSSGYMGFGLNQASFVAAYLPHIEDEGVDVFDYKVRIEKV